MARRRKEVVEVPPVSDPGITPVPDNVVPLCRAQVGVVRVPSRRLVTLRGAHVARADEAGTALGGESWKGAIVRLDPEGLPEEGAEAVLASAKKNLLAAGCAAVKVLPMRGATAVVKPQEEQLPDATAREVVTTMVQEAAVQDRAALAALVEETMTAEGL